jgi:hypothetical protein
MAEQRLNDMTPHQLRALIEQIVEEHLNQRLKPFQQSSKRSISEVLRSIRQNIIPSNPGDPSIIEMLREDRNCGVGDGV